MSRKKRAWLTFMLIVDGNWGVILMAGRRLAAPVAVTLTHPLRQSNQGESVVAGVAQLRAECVEWRHFVASVEQRFRTFTPQSCNRSLQQCHICFLLTYLLTL